MMRSRIAGTIFTILLAFSCSEANAYETKKSGIKFLPEGCEFSAEFPERPKEKGEKGEDHSRYIAFLKEGRSTLRAVCTTFSSEESLDIPDETLSLWGWSYAERNDIRLPEIEVKGTPIGKLVIIKGSRLIDNWAVIFKVHAYYGLTSRMTLTVSIKTKFYPTREGEAFLNSIARPPKTHPQ